MYVYPVPGACRTVPCVVGRGTRIVEVLIDWTLFGVEGGMVVAWGFVGKKPVGVGRWNTG